MNSFRLYRRVLENLGADSRIGWFLALANLALAMAQFAEPVLFGRVVDTLTRINANDGSTAWSHLWLLLIVWAALGYLPFSVARLLRSMPIGWRIAVASRS